MNISTNSYRYVHNLRYVVLSVHIRVGWDNFLIIIVTILPHLFRFEDYLFISQSFKCHKFTQILGIAINSLRNKF